MEIQQQLKKRIQQNNLVVFVGAGVSISSGLPNWNNLVEKILEKLEYKDDKVTKYKAALKDELFTPIEILKKISDYKEEAIEILYEEIKKHDSAVPNSIHYKIGKLTNKIITTNYDTLLEKALPKFEKISYTNKYKIAKLSEIESYIFKIHGDIDEPHKCILFHEDYESLYSSNEETSVFELKKIISDKSILFIGFGLNDPYVNFVFKYINELYSGFSPEHFLITTNRNFDLPKKINPLQINDYSEIESLIDKLITLKEEFKVESETILNTIEKNSSLSIVEFTESPDFDSPPSNKYWVGRSQELKNISSENFKVIFITGIGGQGKSALASHYIKNYFNSELYEFADWRDFKEETNRFQTKLFSMIKRLEPSFEISNFEKMSNKEMVDIFFRKLDNRRIVFVFDNIDSYIDLETFKPSGTLKYFFEQILEKNHNSRFIFTCRPFIREASLNFYQISLSGISKEETETLFSFYDIPISKIQLEDLCNRAHRLTKGHPLWLNLIAGQSIRGIKTVNDFLDAIENKTNFDEDDFSAILSEKILDEVWSSLNDKQKILIRSISETVKPEKEENLKNIISSELNPNQFSKSLRVLKNLNLVEILSDNEIELHPLVKEYILAKYPKNERSKYITLFVRYYDKFIYILKPRLNSNLTLKEFQNWTSKIELQINNNDYSAALISLEEVSNSMLTAGFSEEYLRVAEMLYNNIDWEEAINKELTYFDSQLINITTTQIQMGKSESADNYLEKYKRLIPGKSSKYLIYCSQKCYEYWTLDRFNEAIQIGEEGTYLLNESDLTDLFSLRHNLSLALRDSRVEKDVIRALDYFLMNESLEKILDKNQFSKDFSGTFFGNIGRCLEFLNKNDDALYCYSISLKLLLKENDSNTILNRGFASFWIANLLIENKKIKEALYFIKNSENYWEKTAPPRAKKLKNIWSNIIFDKSTKTHINSLSNWQIENFCKEYLAHQLL